MAVVFNGTSQYITLGNNLQATANMTVSAWINVNAVGARQEIISKENLAADGWEFSIQPSGVLEFGVFTGNYDIATGATSLTPGVWYHVCGVRDSGSSTINVYVNGVLDGSSAITGAPATNTTPTNIARRGGQPDRYFGGTMSDLRVYNVALTESEVSTIYGSKGHDDILDGLLMRQLYQNNPVANNVSPFVDIQSATSGSATSIVVTAPSNQDGDLLVAMIAVTSAGNPSPVVTAPVGWTQANAGNTDATATFSTPGVYIFYKTASSEPASYTFNVAATASIIGVVSSYRDDSLSATPQIQPSVITKGTSTTPTSPSVTPVERSLVIRVAIIDNTASLPTPATNLYSDYASFRRSLNITGNGNGLVLGIAEQILPSGASGTYVWNSNANEEWGALTLVFNGSKIALLDNSFNGVDASPVNDPTYSTDELSLRKRVK